MDSFNKSQKYLIESQSVLEDYILEIEDRVIASVAEDQISYDINKILTLNNPKAYMYLLLKPYGFTDWNEIISLLQAQTGKQIYSPSHRLIKNRNNLILCKINSQLEVNISIQNSDSLIKIPSYGINLQMDITNFVPVKSPESVILDMKTLNFPLTVRNWNEGDYFYPSGMNGKKKLSKFFKDNKLSIVDKENTLILCSNDQVVWVLGMRADNRFMSTKKTINFLNISIKNNASN
tara:strand:- start:1175 stop:1879 length:705 start_codon:yes stop_codon:yes gene_type:complete